MATCEQCGTKLDENDAFCGVCGSFTAWSRGEATSEPALPTAESPRPTEQTLAKESDSATVPRPRSPAPAAIPPAADVPVVTTTSSGGITEQPAAVRPGLPSLERGNRPPTADDYVAGPNDVACTSCQSPNPPDRRFCRRCGTSLAHAPAAKRARWWRRLARRFVSWRRRRRLARRRGVWGVVRRIVTALVALAVIGGIVYLVKPHAAKIVGTVQAHFAKPVPINPQTVTASSSAPGHAAALAADGSATTWWAPAGAANGQWIQADFASSFTLLDVTILSGSSNQQDQYLLEARPATLELTTWTTAGVSATKQIRLEDKPGPQQFQFLIPDVNRIRLTVESTVGEAPGRLTALTEVDFFAES